MRPPDDTGGAFLVAIDRIQPSQLYISVEKLQRVRETLLAADPVSLPPPPVVRLGGDTLLTDGHTRAYAAWSAGLCSLNVTWDTDELDIEAYQICASWCKEEGIHTIGDLQERVVDADAYQALWLDRCAAMHRTLAARRAGR